MQAWMFAGVTLASRSASLSRLGTEGLKTSSPAFAVPFVASGSVLQRFRHRRAGWDGSGMDG